MTKQPIYQASSNKASLRQCELLTGVLQFNPITKELSKDWQEEGISVTSIIHPYSIVVTQNCDLDWDYKVRQSDEPTTKLLNSVVLCEVSLAQDVRNISNKLGMNSTTWGNIKTHKHERYYFFESIPSECELDKVGIPELTADFKRVFAVDASTLYRQIEIGVIKRRAILTSPYLEHFSMRYHNFHSRVALPYDYQSNP